jgi:hypothetical protein
MSGECQLVDANAMSDSLVKALGRQAVWRTTGFDEDKILRATNIGGSIANNTFSTKKSKSLYNAVIRTASLYPKP